MIEEYCENLYERIVKHYKDTGKNVLIYNCIDEELAVDIVDKFIDIYGNNVGGTKINVYENSVGGLKIDIKAEGKNIIVEII